MIASHNNSFEVENFLEINELNFLKILCDKIPDKKNSGNEFKAHTNGFEFDLLPSTLKNKIQTLIGKHTASVTMILKEYTPWVIHTDYPKNDVFKPSWAILIPLDFSNDTHTVIFPQKEKNSFQEYKQKNKKTNYQYNQTELTLLSHIPHDDLNYVSDPIFYKWQIGKLIAWKRDLLHTSDNFKHQNDDYKIALVAFFCSND